MSKVPVKPRLVKVGNGAIPQVSQRAAAQPQPVKVAPRKPRPNAAPLPKSSGPSPELTRKGLFVLGLAGMMVIGLFMRLTGYEPKSPNDVLDERIRAQSMMNPIFQADVNGEDYWKNPELSMSEKYLC